MMNINSYYPTPAAGSFSHQPLSLHDGTGHQLSNGFHHSVTAAAAASSGFMSPTPYSSRPICPGYDLPVSQGSKARFVTADADDQLMRSAVAVAAASDMAANSTREQHQTAAAGAVSYPSLGDPVSAAHHPRVHHHLHHHHHQQQQQQQRWGLTVGDGSSQTSTSPPPPLMQTSAFNHAVHSPHLSRVSVTTDASPPAVSCQSPHSAGTGYNSTGHIPFYPWMGVVGKHWLYVHVVRSDYYCYTFYKPY